MGAPTYYLGAKVKQLHIPGDEAKPCWGFSSNKYVKEAIRTVEIELAGMSPPIKLSNKAATSMASGYHPELDVSPELEPERVHYFMD